MGRSLRLGDKNQKIGLLMKMLVISMLINRLPLIMLVYFDYHIAESYVDHRTDYDKIAANDVDQDNGYDQFADKIDDHGNICN